MNSTNVLDNNVRNYLTRVQYSATSNSLLSGEMEASNAEEQLARDSRIRLPRIFVVTAARPTASCSFSFIRYEYPESPAMPPKTFGSGAKSLKNTNLNQQLKSSFSAELVHLCIAEWNE